MEIIDLSLATLLPTESAPSGSTTSYFYDGGNSGSSAFVSSGFKPTKTVDPLGYVTEVTYDDLYRPTETKVQYDRAGGFAVTKTQYDDVGNPVKVTDPLNKVTLTQFDNLNRPTLVTLADATTRLTSCTGTGFFGRRPIKWGVKPKPSSMEPGVQSKSPPLSSMMAVALTPFPQSRSPYTTASAMSWP